MLAKELQTLIRKAEERLSKEPGQALSIPRQDLEQLLRGCGHLTELENRNDELRNRLEEAEQTVEAIRNGEIDAIVRSGEDGTRIYTLEGPDQPYRIIVETMNAGAVTVDSQAIIFYSNTAFSHMAEIPLQDLIGSSFIDLVIPEDRPLFLDFLEKTRKMEKTTEEIRLRGRKGNIFVRLAGSSQTVDDLERTCIVITNISALKSAEEAVRKEARSAERERDRLMALIDSMNDGVWLSNADGIVLYVNSVGKSQAAEVGLDAEALSRAPSSALLSHVDILTPDGEPLETEPLMPVFRGEPFKELEIAIRNRKTGELFYRRISANPIWDREKRLEGVVTIVRDIAAEKRATAEKARLEEQLRQSQKMEAIGTLAGGIAHDFNNMLAVIMGNAELALDDINGSEAPKRNIEQIVKASKRARDLVKQILAFSRKTERGRKPLKLTPLIKETYDLLRASLPSTIAIDLQIQTKSDTIVTDPSEIQQILMNLATNAAHAMQDKGGTLAIELSSVTFSKDGPLPDREMYPGGYAKLTVRDTGKGMTDKIRSRIFEPFFTTKSAGQGTGMGLAVVYGIVKSHGGAVTVESRPGKGSTFTIFLPHAMERAEEEAKEQGREQRGRERILLVDDEPLILDMVSRILENLGYDVTTAQNGVEALRIFFDKPHHFDLVITDQTMPHLTGVDLAQSMLELRKDTPIILFTGYSEVVSPEKAKAAGVREFVMKPITKREIAKTVRRVLDAQAQTDV